MEAPTPVSFSAPPPEPGRIRRLFQGRYTGRLILVLLTLNVVLGTSSTAVRQIYEGPGPLTEARDVVVPHGGVAQVAAALQQSGVIWHIWSFEVAALLTGNGTLHAAELHFPAFANLQTVLAIVRTGQPAEHKLVIPEGLTARQISHLLAGTEALTGDTPRPAEGAIMPSTYEFLRGATRASIVHRARAAMARDLAQIWASRAPDLPLASPDEALILASIVERETARPEERPRVAAVFLNRLRLGMRLQSDPTVIYAASHGAGTLDRVLTRADLEQDSPYNTYLSHGLPPGPIGSPGLSSLQAVTHPAESSELYFVADGSGGHAFARTLDAHNQNVARWRAAHP